jgi:hypothetical protein
MSFEPAISLIRRSVTANEDSVDPDYARIYLFSQRNLSALFTSFVQIERMIEIPLFYEIEKYFVDKTQSARLPETADACPFRLYNRNEHREPIYRALSRFIGNLRRCTTAALVPDFSCQLRLSLLSHTRDNTATGSR